MSYSPGNNSANYNHCAGNLTTVGSNGGPSSYGTYDQSGQIYEWNDLDGSPNKIRGLRGGSWSNDAFSLSSSTRWTVNTWYDINIYWGFRLASLLNPLNLPYFVSVGDVDNVNDSTGYGSVNYQYQIGKYLVTNAEYAAFLNAKAATDPYGLFNPAYNPDPRVGILRSGSSGSYTYATRANMCDKPATMNSWFDCARYCNWLHNGKGNGDTETGAYTLNGSTSGFSVAKNPGANYYIPTENEWYKAAYYKGGGTNAGYWTYATQSNNDPTCVTANNFGDGPVSSSYSCIPTTPTPTPTPAQVVACDKRPIKINIPKEWCETGSELSKISIRIGGPDCCGQSNIVDFICPTRTPTKTPTPTNTKTPTATPTNTITPSVQPNTNCKVVLGSQHSIHPNHNSPLDTNIDLTAGETLTITATGLIDTNWGKGPWGPDGIIPEGVDPGTGFTIMALLGRIGSGPIFKVGSSYSETVTNSGRLYLFFNDTPISDNSGSFTACITISSIITPTPTTTLSATPTRTPDITPTPTNTNTPTPSTSGNNLKTMFIAWIPE